jgi:hypothetical protein
MGKKPLISQHRNREPRYLLRGDAVESAGAVLRNGAARELPDYLRDTAVAIADLQNGCAFGEG